MQPMGLRIVQADPRHLEGAKFDQHPADLHKQVVAAAAPRDGLVDLAQRCIQPRDAFEFALARLLCGDITDHREHVAVGQGGRDHFRIEDQAVLAPELPLALALGGGLDRVERHFDLQELARRNDVGGVHADQFLARVAQHPADAGIRIEVVALRVGDQDAVRRKLEERAIARFDRQRFPRRARRGIVIRLSVGGLRSHRQSMLPHVSAQPALRPAQASLACNVSSTCPP